VPERDRVLILDPTRGVVRTLRAAAVGSAAVLVTMVGHLAGGGAVPSPAMIGLLGAAATAVAWTLSLARWNLRSLTGVLVVSQAGLHLCFTMAAGDAAQHHTMPMLLGHAAATVVMVALLNGGESLLWSVVESLGLRVWRLLRPAALPQWPTVPRPARRRRPAAPRSWHGLQPPRRGPPTGSSSPSVPA
jgi:hypothetical protein